MGDGTLPSGVVTFLLTDIEGSTALWDSAPDAMPSALDRHDAIIDAAVTAAGGVVLKDRGEGDSTFCVFGRASDAAVAAVHAQDALTAEPWPEVTPIRVRMALHTGETVERDRDYVGPTVNRAARLRAVATGGQVVMSVATASLIADHLPDGATLRELGEFALAGLSRPERVLLLTQRADQPPDAPAATVTIPLPGPLAVTETLPLVGRTNELDALRSALGRVPLAAVAGEPGVGKTRLATELAREAHDRGDIVLFGRCTEELGVPFQPFAEALERYVADAPLDRLREHVAVHGGVLVRLAPSLGRRVGGLIAPTDEADGDAGRARLHEAVVDLVGRAGRVLLVIDDLHWAARPTLQLLRRLVDTVSAVVTYRDTELDRTHPLAAALADLRVDGVVERITIGGLDPDGVAALVDAAASIALGGNGAASSSLAAAVHERTEGNPFFVGQVLRDLSETGQWRADLGDALPEGVREVVGRRLSRLDPATNQVLTVAAIAGAEFDLDVLERLPAGAIGDSDVLDALDEAVGARILAEVPGPVDRYRFVHALVRETVLAELSSARKARLHRHVADAVALVRPTDVTALAHHYAEAARAGDTDKAIDYALRAAAEALVRCSYDEVVAHAERGLQVLELDNDPSIEARVQLLRARVDGLAGAGDANLAVQAIVEAAPVAREAGDVDTFVAIVGARVPVGLLADLRPLDALAEEALQWPGAHDSAAMQFIRIRTALAAVFAGEGHTAIPKLRPIIADARAADDPDALAPALMMYVLALHGSIAFEEQEATAAELRALEPRLEDRFARVLAMYPSIVVAVNNGQLIGAYDRLDWAEHLLPAAWARYLSTIWRVQEALARGQFDDAEALLGTVLEYADAPIALLSWAADLIWLRGEQGRVDEILPMFSATDTSAVDVQAAWTAARARALASTGDVDGAVDLARQLAADDFAAVPANWTSAAATAWLTDVAAIADERELAAQLLPRFDGYEGRLLTAAFVFVTGATDRFRGMLLSLLDRHDEAVSCFEAALVLEDGAPAPPLAARTRYWFARALLARGESGDAERAAVLAAEARSAAESMGMVQLARETAALPCSDVTS